MHSVLSEISNFARTAAETPLPPAVTVQLKQLLLEGISWMVLGTQREEGRRLLAGLERVHPGRCSVPGYSNPVGLVEAARVNVSLAQVYDCNDGRRLAWTAAGLWHPGRYIIPTALALAEHYDLSGQRLLRLLSAGYEIGGKAQAVPNEMAGSLAVAAMIGSLTCSSSEEIQRALVMAWFNFPRMPAWPDDLDLNHLKYGFIVRSALQAALNASEAVAVPEDQCVVQLREPFYTSNPGTINLFECMQIYLKPYPCCRSLCPAVDLAIELQRSGQIKVEEIESIEVTIGDANGAPFNLPYTPGSHYKYAQFSVPFVVASALLDGKLDPPQFDAERMAREDVQQLQKRIQVHFDPKMNASETGEKQPAILRVRNFGGTILETGLDSPLGAPSTPLTEAQIEEKFRRWTAPALSDRKQSSIIAQVQSIEQSKDVRALTDLLRG